MEAEVAFTHSEEVCQVVCQEEVGEEVPHKGFREVSLSNDETTRRMEDDFRTTAKKTNQNPASKMSMMFPRQTLARVTTSICYASLGWGSCSPVSLFHLTCWHSSLS